MLLSILAVCSSEELEESPGSFNGDRSSVVRGAGDDAAERQILEQRQLIKNKILAVAKMQRVFKLLRSVLTLSMLSSRRLIGHDMYRDEAENATELIDGADSPTSVNDNSLHVQDAGEHIQTFADAYVKFYIFPIFTEPKNIRHQSDLLNERLPTFLPQPASTQLGSAPSMRRGTTSSDKAAPFRLRIRETMEDDSIESVVKLADQVARSITGKPHEDRITTPPRSGRMSAGMYFVLLPCLNIDATLRKQAGQVPLPLCEKVSSR
jgi:serine/threonine-protein phosphatase 2B catalytic subunit